VSPPTREAADLYKENLAPYIIVTHEAPEPTHKLCSVMGLNWWTVWGNYIRVLRGFGVPKNRIIAVLHGTDDTLDR